MRRILIGVMLAVLVFGCKRECDCPVDCGVASGGTTVAVAPAVVPGATAAALAGATAAAGSTVAAPTAGGTVSAAAEPLPAPEKEYCASESGEVFHRCSCTSVRRIKRAKLVRLGSRAEALASGRRPCKHCKP